MSYFLKRYGKLLITLVMTVLLVVSASGIVISQEDTPSDTSPKAAPVILDDEKLFDIRVGVETFSPAERAKAVNIRLQEVAQDRSIQLQDIQLEAGKDISKISVGGIRIVGIRETDAAAAAVPREELAAEYLKRIKSAIQNYRQERSLRRRVLRVVYALFIAIAIYIFFKRFPIFSRYIFPRLEAWRERSLADSQETSIENPWVEVADLLLIVARIIRLSLFGGLAYIYSIVVLNFFPGTEDIAIALRRNLASQLSETGQSIVAYLPNLFQIALSILIANFTLRFAKVAFRRIERGAWSIPGFYQDWAQPTYTLCRLIIIIFTAVVVIPYLPGYGSGAFKGLSLFVGFLLSFNSGGTINNVISGIVLIYTRGFRIGDRIAIDDTIGLVVDQSLLVIRIKTIKNVQVTIPNSIVLSKQIINYSAIARDTGLPLILHTTITLGYDLPWQKIEQALISAAQITQHVLKEPKPFVWQTSLDDYYVSYELNAYIEDPIKLPAIQAELHQHIQDKCNENDIEILSPQYSAIRDGNHTTIPQSYLPKNYESPNFRISGSTQQINPPDKQNNSSNDWNIKNRESG